MQPWAERFYKSKAWQRCRDGYAASVGGLCERCLNRGIVTPGVIVHHKVWLSPESIGDPGVSMCWDNLELLCRECHAEEHAPRRRRFTVDELGRVSARGS